MPLRRASAYSKKPARPFTRKSNVKSKSYIKTIPPQKIVKFKMGDIKGFEEGRFNFIIRIKSGENIQIRDLALEACRQTANRIFEKELIGQYFFEVKVFPHHIIRENKVYGGGSKGERVNTGMKQSFGTTMGRAAFVKKDQVLFIVGVNTEKAMKLAMETLRKIKSKLPCKALLSVEQKK